MSLSFRYDYVTTLPVVSGEDMNDSDKISKLRDLVLIMESIQIEFIIGITRNKYELIEGTIHIY
jgi:hypothetical protein